MQLEQPTDYFVYPIFWGNGVVYRRSHVCSILTSVVGKEQRSVLNTLVRRELEYSVVTRSQTETYYLKSRLRLYMHLVWGVPLWFYDMQLTADASGTTLNVNETDYRELAEGQEVIIVTDYKTYEVGTIDTGGIAATTITLASSLSSTWPNGTKVYPVLRCEIGSTQEMEFMYKHLLKVSVLFIESFRGGDYTTTTTTTTTSTTTTTTA